MKTALSCLKNRNIFLSVGAAAALLAYFLACTAPAAKPKKSAERGESPRGASIKRETKKPTGGRKKSSQLKGVISPVEIRATPYSYRPEDKDPSGFTAVIRPQREETKLRTLGEILREIAGVQIRTAGGVGAWSSISIRGSSPSQVQILFDGIPLNSGAVGAVNLGDLPLDAIGEIAVYRGFSPLHLGGNIGGLVELKSRSPDKKALGWHATVGSGSFRTLKLNGSISYRSPGLKVLGFLQYLGSAGDFIYYDDRGTPYRFDDDIPDAIRVNNRSDLFSALGKLDLRLTRKLTLKSAVFSTVGERGIPGIANFPSETAKYGHQKVFSKLGLAGKASPKFPLNWVADGFFLYLNETFSDPNGEIGLGRQEARYSTSNFGIKLLARWLPTLSLELTGSTELKGELFIEEDSLDPRRKEPARRNRWQWDSSLQFLLTLWGEKLSLVAGARLLVVKNDYLKDILLPPQLKEFPLSAAYPIARVGFRLRPWRAIFFQANAGYFVRIPTFWELFGDRGTSTGNPTLRPESSFNADAGFVISLSSDSIQLFRLSSSFFLSRGFDLIRFIQNSQRTMIPINIDSSLTLGFEGELKFHFLKYFRLSGDLTLMDPRNLSPAPYERGKLLPGRAAWQLSVRTEAVTSPAEIFLSLFALGNNFLDRANLKELAPRFFLNAGFSIYPGELLRMMGYSVPWRGLQLTFEMKNILDYRVANVPLRPPLGSITEIPQAIADFSGYPLPGREFFLSVKWKN